MTSGDNPTPAPAGSAETGQTGMDGHEAAGNHTPRLVVSWLIVGLPLAYGIYQTISRTLPLFGG